jgi:hypothetical protein
MDSYVKISEARTTAVGLPHGPATPLGELLDGDRKASTVDIMPRRGTFSLR